MMLCIDRDLDIVADHPGPPAAGRHGACIRIGQRDLLVRLCQHLSFQPVKAPHLLLKPGDLLLEPFRFGGQYLGRFLTVGGIELREIPCNALLDLLPSALQLGLGEVAIAVVYRLKLTAVDGDAPAGQKAHLAAPEGRSGCKPLGSQRHCHDGSPRSSCDLAPADQPTT